MLFMDTVVTHMDIVIACTSDISATVAENFGVDKAMIGESFLDKLI